MKQITNFNRRKLKSLIKSQGLKSTWVAEQLHITREYFQYIKSGHRSPSKELFKRICDLFGVNGEDLFR